MFFGVLSSSAASAASEPAPQLRARPTAAGLPAAVGPAVQGFVRCFADRSASADPTAQPPSCRALANRGGSAGAAFADASTSALSATFSNAIRWGLAYEVLVFLLAALLVLRLPRHTSDHEGDAAPEQTAAAVG